MKNFIITWDNTNWRSLTNHQQLTPTYLLGRLSLESMYEEPIKVDIIGNKTEEYVAIRLYNVNLNLVRVYMNSYLLRYDINPIGNGPESVIPTEQYSGVLIWNKEILVSTETLPVIRLYKVKV